MADKDITGRAVERAIERVNSIRSKVADAVPLGPQKMAVTPTELKKTYDQMTPEERTALAASQGGIDMALEMMNGNA